MCKRPDYKPTIRVGELALQKEAALSRLRPEVREFAHFVLSFRNQRRGVTPAMNGLVKWYAQMTGKRASDVRRYLPRLDEAGIVSGDVMHPMFQFAGTKVRRRSHLAEANTAALKFSTICRRYRFQKADSEARAALATRHDLQPWGEPPIAVEALQAREHAADRQATHVSGDSFQSSAFGDRRRRGFKARRRLPIAGAGSTERPLCKPAELVPPVCQGALRRNYLDLQANVDVGN
jgi:hypothetical protein